MAVPTRSVATTAGTPKTIFCSSTAPTNDSSELACRRDKSCCDSSAHSSPHAHAKSQISQKSWGGWRWHSRGVVCPERGVETLLSILPTSLSALLPLPSASAVYFEHTHPHPATPADSLAYTTQWADRVTTSPHTNSAVCTTPSELRPAACLSHQSIIAEMYVILQIPNPIQRELCHVSVREDARLPLILAPKKRPIHFGLSCIFVQPNRNADPTRNTSQNIFNTGRLTRSFHFEYVTIT